MNGEWSDALLQHTCSHAITEYHDTLNYISNIFVYKISLRLSKYRKLRDILLYFAVNWNSVTNNHTVVQQKKCLTFSTKKTLNVK